ncbi:MAG: VOC family protein, partial [Planctomycetota bacterium]
MEYNSVGWFEIYVSDMPKAVTFYEQVLQVTMEKLPEEVPGMELEMMCFPMQESAPGAGGALVSAAEGKPGIGGTLVYFGSEDCEQEASRVEAAGGHLVKPKFQIGPY